MTSAGDHIRKAEELAAQVERLSESALLPAHQQVLATLAGMHASLAVAETFREFLTPPPAAPHPLRLMFDDLCDMGDDDAVRVPLLRVPMRHDTETTTAAADCARDGHQNTNPITQERNES